MTADDFRGRLEHMDKIEAALVDTGEPLNEAATWSRQVVRQALRVAIEVAESDEQLEAWAADDEGNAGRLREALPGATPLILRHVHNAIGQATTRASFLRRLAWKVRQT